MEMHKKLKFTEKLSYGIADLPEAANSIIAAFLTMFYTDNIGLAAAAVGTMFFISKLFDGISDILAGILIVIIVTSLTLVGIIYREYKVLESEQIYFEEEVIE